METFFDKSNQEQFKQRFEKLTAVSGSQWGKMSSAQMLSHCSAPMQVAIGELQMKKHPLRFLGSILKKSLLGEKPFSKNSPTAREFVRTQDCDFDAEKQKFMTVFNKFAQGPSAITCFNHGFFGKMTEDEWGRLIYKHLDHHLKQFGV
jgi:Protein of unknown function (DUF1569)